jgi:hypothetical protein
MILGKLMLIHVDRVEWFVVFEKFKSPVVSKDAYVYYNKLVLYNFLKFSDLPLVSIIFPLKKKYHILNSSFLKISG